MCHKEQDTIPLLMLSTGVPILATQCCLLRAFRLPTLTSKHLQILPPLRRYFQRPLALIVHPLPEDCTTVDMGHGEPVRIAQLTMYAFYNLIETGTFFKFKALAGYAFCHIA